MTAPIVTIEQAQAVADALLERFTVNSSGHRPFCWCHNHADADGVFHWTAALPALRFPLEGGEVIRRKCREWTVYLGEQRFCGEPRGHRNKHVCVIGDSGFVWGNTKRRLRWPW